MMEMPELNDEEYKNLILETLNDAIYVKGLSNRGKAAAFRKYGEILLRKVLNVEEWSHLKLGGQKEQISKLDVNGKLLWGAIENIRKKGNIGSHTGDAEKITENDIIELHDSIQDIHAVIFVKFFTKGEDYQFGRTQEIVSAFSILPPNLRLKVLKILYEAEKNNVVIIDKLALAILKTGGLEASLDWLEEHKDDLSSMSPFPETTVNMSSNMYEISTQRVLNVGETLKRRGILYSTYEEAKALYERSGFVMGSTNVVKEFNSLMQFIYLGRQSQKIDVVELSSCYVTLDDSDGVSNITFE